MAIEPDEDSAVRGARRSSTWPRQRRRSTCAGTGSAAIVDIEGDVTAGSEEPADGAYDEAADARAIVLNFAGLAYMNSGGIGLLVTLLVRANRQSQRLLAYGLTEHYRQIFELTRLDEAIGIHDDEQAALAAAGVRRTGDERHERPADRRRWPAYRTRRRALGTGRPG